MNSPSFANNVAWGSDCRFACKARAVGRATTPRMIDEPDGGAVSEPITSWQPSTEIESDGVGDAVDVDPQSVAVMASTQIANEALRANARGATAIGTRIGAWVCRSAVWFTSGATKSLRRVSPPVSRVLFPASAGKAGASWGGSHPSRSPVARRL
jgi:hypothetical protein